MEIKKKYLQKFNGFKSYQEYLNSWGWKDKIKYILELEEIRDIKNKRTNKWKCEKCYKFITNPEFHHLTYISVGFERREDLLLLCKNCHKKIHGIFK